VISAIWNWIKKACFVSSKVRTGKNFHIGLYSIVTSPKTLEIGDDVYVGKHCSIQVSGRIGNGVLIANNVGIVGRRDHDIHHIGVPIRLANWIGDFEYLANDPKSHVDIEDDVWIGFGAIIMSGIRIGRGAVVASGAVVLRDVEPYAIVAGNPAVKIANRFNAADVADHEKIMADRGYR
jgi:acetyltransferase-like isoleucine patch superfamily enzyme